MFWYQSIIFHHKLMESMWSLCCCVSCLLDKSDSWGTGFIQIGTSNSWPAVDYHKTLIHWINKPTSTTRCAWVLVLFFFLQAVWDCRYFSEVRGRVWLTVTNWQQTVSANSRLLVQHNVLFRHFSSMFQICLSHINKGTLTDIPICYITAKYVAKYMKCDVAERFVCVYCWVKTCWGFCSPCNCYYGYIYL